MNEMNYQLCFPQVYVTAEQIWNPSAEYFGSNEDTLHLSIVNPLNNIPIFNQSRCVLMKLPQWMMYI
jgi:hypothetical protein